MPLKRLFEAPSKGVYLPPMLPLTRIAASDPLVSGFSP